MDQENSFNVTDGHEPDPEINWEKEIYIATKLIDEENTNFYMTFVVKRLMQHLGTGSTIT
jgi:hypothetical protein